MENNRKQYNAQDSFRWTTPKVDVVARPVDPFVTPVHQKVIKDSGAGTLAPQAPIHRPAPIQAADGTPYRIPNANYNAVSMKDDGVGAIAQFLGSQLGNAWGAYQNVQKVKAEEATNQYVELRAEGVSHQDALKQSSPDTFFGMAERLHERAAAGVDFAGIASDVDVMIQQARPDESVEAFGARVNGYLKDRLTGMPKAYKDAILEKAVGLQDKAIAAHSNRLQEFTRKDELSKQAQLLPEVYKFVQAEYAGDTKAYFRKHVDEMIQQNESFFGIQKLDTAKMVINSLLDDALLDTSKYGSVDDFLGWMKESGKDGVVPVKNPELADLYQKAESKFNQQVEHLADKAEKDLKKSQEAVYDGFMQEIDQAMRDGKTGITGFMDRVNDPKTAESMGFKYRMNIEKFYKEWTKPKEGESSFYRDQKIASMQGNYNALNDHATLEAKFRSGSITWTEYKDLATDVAHFSDVTFREQVANLKSTFAVAGIDSGDAPDWSGGGGKGLNANQRLALSDFQGRYKAEIEANKGVIPSATRINELATETIKSVKGTAAPLPDVTGFAQKTVGMKPDEILKMVENDFGAKSKAEKIRIVEAVVAEQKKTATPPPQVKTSEQKVETPKQPEPPRFNSMEELKDQQGTLRPSSAQQWMNDNIMNDDLLKGFVKLGRLGYEPAPDGSESAIAVMLRNLGKSPEYIAAAIERVKEDHERQQEFMRR